VTWSVVWTRRSQRDLRNLDPTTATRVSRAVQRLAADQLGDVKQLQGRPEWRLRVGDVQVLFVFDAGTQTMTVLRVLPRGRAYRD
jgi:mRNA interferase RelE/StbE